MSQKLMVILTHIPWNGSTEGAGRDGASVKATWEER